MTEPSVDGVKVGDVFYRSWGYDQTQVNWYVVVALTPKRVKIQEISGMRIAETRVMPNLESERFGEIMVKQVQRYNDRACFAFNSYSSCYQWDGDSQYATGYGMGH
jgi:hypothetical protein